MAASALSAQQVIDQILEDPRAQVGGRFAGGHFTSRTYADEPILMTGKAMVSALPEPYRAARRLAHDSRCHGVSNAWLLYQQGRVLADLEDDAPYTGTFVRYFPTYQDLNDRQLRGYVTWRTAVRAGRVEPAPATFMFLYAYELLNGIGVDDPGEGFCTLKSFWERYRGEEPSLDRYLPRWLVDMVVYHGLDNRLVADDPLLNADVCWDGHLQVLSQAPERSEREVFDAWVALSSYRFETSRLYRAYPDDARAVTLAVLERLAAYYDKHRKSALHASLFGSWGSRPCQLFASAVVYHEAPHPDGIYELDPLRTYVCAQGRWTCSCYAGTRDGRKRLGIILKAIDAALRRRWEFAYPLKQPQVPKYLEQIIDRAIDERHAWKVAHEPRRIQIDRSKLSGIRSGAAQTCEALLVDEERFDDAPAQPPTPLPGEPVRPQLPDAPPEPSTAAQPGPLGLTSVELRLLEALLAGEPAAAPEGSTLDLLVDAINEKLFDLLGDTAIEFDGDAPVLIDDYRDDVEGALAP